KIAKSYNFSFLILNLNFEISFYMAQSFPADVIVLDEDALLHARLARGKKGPRIVQAKSYRLGANTFVPAVVTPQLTNESSLADAVRRLRVETGRWDSASVLLPD